MGIIAFSIGDFNVYWYGLLVSLAIIFGILITGLNLYFRRKNMNHLVEIFIYSILSGIIGARIYYVILHFDIYRNNLLEIFALNHGGVSIYGAFIGFILAIFIYTSIYNLRIWYWLDVLAPAVVLGIIIIQLSNFALQATIGLPVIGNEVNNSRIIEYIEYSFRPFGFKEYEYFRPVALYQAGWQILIFLLVSMLSLMSARLKLAQGNIFLLSMILLCLGRILLSPLYLGANGVFGLHLSQIICFFIMIVSGYIMFNNKFMIRNSKRQIFH